MFVVLVVFLNILDLHSDHWYRNIFSHDNILSAQLYLKLKRSNYTLYRVINITFIQTETYFFN